MAFKMSSEEWAEHKKGRKNRVGKGDREGVWLDAERGLEGSALVAIGTFLFFLLLEEGRRLSTNIRSRWHTLTDPYDIITFHRLLDFPPPFFLPHNALLGPLSRPRTN